MVVLVLSKIYRINRTVQSRLCLFLFFCYDSFGKYGNKNPATIVIMYPPEMNRIEINFLKLIEGFSHARK